MDMSLINILNILSVRGGVVIVTNMMTPHILGMIDLVGRYNNYIFILPIY